MTSQQHHQLNFTPLSLKNDIGDTKSQMAKLGAALKKLKQADNEIAKARVQFGDIAYREYMTETSLQKNSNYSGALLGEFGKKFKALGMAKLPQEEAGKKSKKSTADGPTTGGDILGFSAENIEKGYCPEVRNS